MGASVRPDDLDALIAARQAALGHAPAAQSGHDDLDALIASRQAIHAGLPAKVGVAALQGLTLGFGDELGGAASATASAADDALHGRPTHFAQDYAKSRDAIRSIDNQFATEHPATHAVLEMAGAVVPTVLTGGAADAAIGTRLGAGFGRRVLGSAITGAVTSAGFGAGDAQGSATDRLISAGRALPAGAAVGAALPVLGKAFGQVPKLVRSTTGLGTKAEAIRQIGEVANQSGRAPAAIAQAAAADKAAGSPIMLADALGDNGRSLVRWTTNQNAQGGADLRTALEDRNAGQYGRIIGGVGSAYGQPANTPQTIEGLIAARRASAGPLYSAAYAAPDYSSASLDAAMKSPTFQKAIEQGHELAYSQDVADAIRNGTPLPQRTPPPTATPTAGQTWQQAAIMRQFANDPVMQKIALSQLPATPQGGAASVPIRTLDFAKRYLDNGIRRGFDAQSTFDHTKATVTNSLLSPILSEVDAAVPEYAKARGVYHSDSRMLDVADQAQKVATMTPDELAATLKGLSPSEKDLFRSVAMSEFKNAAGGVADRNDLSKRFLSDQNTRQKFEMLAPDQQAYGQLSSLADRESRMARTLNAATGNSTTAAQLQMDRAMNGGIGPADLAVLPLSPHRTMVRLAGRVGQMLRDQSNTKLANQLGPMLMSEPGTPAFSDVIAALGSGNVTPSPQVPNRVAFQNALIQAFAAQAAGRQRQ